jgi:hypothetical protein
MPTVDYNHAMLKTQLDKLIKDHEAGLPFTAQEVQLTETDCKLWVQFKTEPQRFIPKIFDGEWALTQKNPSGGVIRVIRVITGTDGISRTIGRQGNKVYAYPWFA